MNEPLNEIDLAEYLPPFLREYKELRAVMETENPEFEIAWKAARRVLDNEFLETADEYGIERFEKLLGIIPSRDDTLESRRTRAYSRWFTELPYTLRMFARKLELMSGGSKFTITEDYEHYRVRVDTGLELFGQADELERLIEQMFPCNITADVRNTIRCEAEFRQSAGGAVVFTEYAVFSNDRRESLSASGELGLSGTSDNCYFISAAS